MKKIKKIILFIRSQKIIKFPIKNNFLIYDLSGSSLIKNFLKLTNCSIYYNRFEKIYIFIFIISFFNSLFGKKNISYYYKKFFLKHVKPKVILTYIDNNPSFFEIKKIYPSAKTISIQNGSRINLDQFYNKKKNYYADLICVWNKYYKKLYKKGLKGKIIEIGSFKSNQVKIFKNKIKNKILFISHFRDYESINDTFQIHKKKKITWKKYYESESKILPILEEEIKKNKKKFYILGATNLKKEENFYKKILKYNFSFIKNNTRFGSYRHIDQSELVISVDSALGYESLSRLNKTVFLSIRSKELNIPELKFGFPKTLKDLGFFWINYFEKNEIKKIINNNLKIDLKNWKKKNFSKFNDLMCYDFNNIILKKELAKIW